MKHVHLRHRKSGARHGDNRLSLILVTAEYPLDIRSARSVFETKLLDCVLRAYRGNVSHAARVLRLSRRSLQHKIRNLGIDIGRIRSEAALLSPGR
jgi:DNA-binding NtrC family response regulator